MDEKQQKTKIDVKNLKRNHPIENSKPLKTQFQIDLALNKIREKSGPKTALRNEIIFIIGLNNGLRTKDILNLKTKDVAGKSSIWIKETKRGKAREVYFNDNLKEKIAKYIDERPVQSEWLFPSPKRPDKPIETQAIYRLFKRVSVGEPQLAGLTAHTMRKTYGYLYYKKTHDIATLMKLFHHSSEDVTLHYIGIEDEDISKTLRSFQIIE